MINKKVLVMFDLSYKHFKVVPASLSLSLLICLCMLLHHCCFGYEVVTKSCNYHFHCLFLALFMLLSCHSLLLFGLISKLLWFHTDIMEAEVVDAATERNCLCIIYQIWYISWFCELCISGFQLFSIQQFKNFSFCK